MRPLYEIDQAILDCLDEETGEIIDPERLDALQMERKQKLEGVALWIKDMTYEAQMVKEEADKLTARRKALENRVTSLKAWLVKALEGRKLKTPRCNVYTRAGVKVNVIDELSVINWIQTHYQEPEQFLKYGAPEIRKTAVKEELENGTEIPGAALELTESVVIK